MKNIELIQRAINESGSLTQEEKTQLLAIDFGKGELEIKSLQESLKALELERDTAKKQLDDHVYRGNVVKLAERYNFSDKNYLEYLCRQRNINCDDALSYEPLLEELKTSSPKLFNLNLKAGYNLNETTQNSTISAHDNRDIISLLTQAPEIK